MNQANIDINESQCLHHVTNWGETVWYNVCADPITSKIVAWGTIDYAVALLLAFLWILALIVACAICFRVVCDT